MNTQAPQFGWLLWLVTSLAAAVLILVFANIVAEGALRTKQSEVLTRQAYIDESVVLSRLNGQIIQLLASLSAEANDESIRTMLQQHGITFSTKSNSVDAPADVPHQ